MLIHHQNYSVGSPSVSLMRTPLLPPHSKVPDPATVRPEPVLRQALDHHLQRYIPKTCTFYSSFPSKRVSPISCSLVHYNRWELRSTDPKGINYEFICSQLKAIRQDLTIQRIRNDLTINAVRLWYAEY